jgi:hypothetical protein
VILSFCWSHQVINLAVHIATVSVAGGWGQSGGHSFVSHLYGLGADQFLEFKVVTVDGKLKVANKVSNPDLFWALRGGSGGAWGVVVEATVKAHPTPPTVLHTIWINSSTSTAADYFGVGDGKKSQGLWDAIAYLGSQFPSMVDKGAGGIFLPTYNGFVGISLFIGVNATEAYAKSVWDPVLDKMQTFPGMDRYVTNTTVFPTYQDFFGYAWPGLGKTTGGSGTGDSPRYGKLFTSLVEDGTIDKDKLGHLARYIVSEKNVVEQQNAAGYAWDGDYSPPTPGGLLPMDNRLLGRKHLESLPTSSTEMRQQFGSRFILEVVAGPKTHNPADDVSVLPAWRKAYVSAYTPYAPPYLSADSLRKLAPDSGAYINEVKQYTKLRPLFCSMVMLTLIKGILRRKGLEGELLGR